MQLPNNQKSSSSRNPFSSKKIGESSSLPPLSIIRDLSDDDDDNSTKQKKKKIKKKKRNAYGIKQCKSKSKPKSKSPRESRKRLKSRNFVDENVNDDHHKQYLVPNNKQCINDNVYFYELNQTQRNDKDIKDRPICIMTSKSQSLLLNEEEAELEEVESLVSINIEWSPISCINANDDYYQRPLLFDLNEVANYEKCK